MQAKLYEGFVAGLVYGDFDVDNLKLKKGQKVKLTHEHDNPHDRNAIKLTIGRKKLGYIPRFSTEILHSARERRIPLSCVIKQVAKTNYTHRMVLVQVFGKKAAPASSDFINY